MKLNFINLFRDPDTKDAKGGATEILLKEIKDSAEKTKTQIDGVKTELKADLEASKKSITEIGEDVVKAKITSAEALKKSEDIEKSFAIIRSMGDKGGQKNDLMVQMEKKTADLQSLKSNRSGSVELELKAATTMSVGNYGSGSVGLTTFDNEFTRVVRRQPYIRNIISTRPIGTAGISWAEMSSPDGGAGMTAEGAAKTQADFDIVERRETAKKLTSYIKVSKEALDDIPFLYSEINQELVELIELKLDDQILAGDNTGNNLKGILQYAPTFSVAATVLALGVDNANNFDVIRAAAWQIANSGKGRYLPSYAVLNPIDAAVMDVTKATDGHYILPPFATADGQMIHGIRIIENVGITAGTFLVGDFKKDVLGIREGITLNVGYENDDFTKNLVTILAEMRAFNYIKTNNTTAFVQGSFATAKAAMETA